jgi:uncharacterized protein YukE
LANGYEIRPETLRTAANGLKDSGDRLTQEWSNLLSTVEGMGDPFGGDDIGMIIGESYYAVQDQADESFSGAAEDLGALAEKLVTMADNHEKAEQQMAGDVNAVSTALNG